MPAQDMNVYKYDVTQMAGLHNKHWPAGPPTICSRRASDMQLLLARRATKFFLFCFFFVFFLPNHVLYVVPYVGF